MNQLTSFAKKHPVWTVLGAWGLYTLVTKPKASVVVVTPPAGVMP